MIDGKNFALEAAGAIALTDGSSGHNIAISVEVGDVLANRSSGAN